MLLYQIILQNSTLFHQQNSTMFDKEKLTGGHGNPPLRFLLVDS